MTFIEKQIARSEKMLARWRGNPAMIRGPRGMGIVDAIVDNGEPGKNLLIACIGPQSVSGPREWSNSHIILRPCTLDDGNEGVELLDEANGVRIVSGAFEVKENVKLKRTEAGRDGRGDNSKMSSEPRTHPGAA
jgi:hypothetical protein